ncbi:hypothetical protein DASC09_047360 [Saccharomycopsis crataegensis]|uniref:Uncharacterized protein n=1 Tax=Saccharomycopsis crataegensis TaxID=43959 RepID=A0AAV5QS51_9ASCO|nr:hypothetical protein DASC09_047360 [Saccharomycopsis crataegensis]
MLAAFKRSFSSKGPSRISSTLRVSQQEKEPELPVAKSSAYAKTQDIANDRRAYVRLPGVFFSAPMPDNYRLGYFPIYTAPGLSYVSLVKRVTLGLSVVGTYAAYMIDSGSYLSFEAAAIIGALSVLPLPIVQYFTKDYVTRIYRLYNTDQTPQTYENLTKDETLVVEKMMMGGKRCYNELVKMDNLKLKKTWYGTTVWQHIDDQGVERTYTVADDIGGIKMDRLWGIAEKNTGIDNGRLLMEK